MQSNVEIANLSWLFRWYLTEVEHCCASIHNKNVLQHPKYYSPLHPDPQMQGLDAHPLGSCELGQGFLLQERENNSIDLIDFALLFITENFPIYGTYTE